MSIRGKNTQGVHVDPSGNKIIRSAEGGPRRIMCPSHHLPASPQTTAAGTVFVCARGCRFKTTPLR